MTYRLYRSILRTALLAGILLPGLAAAEAKDAPWLTGDWTCRRAVRVEEGFFVLGEDLCDFPLLVAIAGEGDPLFEKARPDGSDLRFTAEDGVTPLSHDLEPYRGSAGDRGLACWVRIPVVRADSDTPFYLYYGNSNPPASPGGRARDVWTNGFAGVWHFSDTNRPGRTFGEVTAAPGVVGGGALFGKDGGINVGILPSLAELESFTLEAWVNYTKNPILGPRTTRNIAGTRDFSLFRHEAFRWQGGLGRNAAAGLSVHASDPNPVGVWRYLALVYDGQSGAFTLFIDGKPATGASRATGANRLESPAPVDRPFRIGGDYIGTLDEVRVSAVARSADWLAISYRNQKSPGSRIVIGPEETRKLSQ